jgi:GDP-4-dehydro-6-deoxy-D-mannose reductase
VVVPSSAYVYRPAGRALTEDDPVEATNPYAISKVATEVAVVRAARVDGIRAVVARSFNHIGPRQDPSFFASGVARQVALIEAGRLEPIIHVGNLESRRDFTDVRDTVRAYRALAERGTPGRAYNVCSGHAHRMRDLLDGIVACARVTGRFRSVSFRPNDTPPSSGPAHRNATGWERTRSRTLQDLLDWCAANRHESPSRAAPATSGGRLSERSSPPGTTWSSTGGRPAHPGFLPRRSTATSATPPGCAMRPRAAGRFFTARRSWRPGRGAAGISTT